MHNTIMKEIPFRRIECSDDILGIAWKPKSQSEKNKFYVYTKCGIIEEKTLIEKESFTMDMSSRGSVCFVAKDKKKLHVIPFFES